MQQNLWLAAIYTRLPCRSPSRAMLIAVLAMSGSSAPITLNALRARTRRADMIVLVYLVPMALALGLTGQNASFTTHVSGSFAAKDVVRTSLVLTVIAFVLVMVLGATYGRWLGYV
jgi:solute carrier family 13 (sodium-dependent dicarboxylate transporter), member 2/3/5